MSKIGRKAVNLPKGIEVILEENLLEIKGKDGEISLPILKGLKVIKKDDDLTVEPLDNSKSTRSNWGTMRSLINNAVIGLTQGFEKTLILEGVGYRVMKEDNNLVMSLGFSHPLRYQIPAGINVAVEKNSILKIKGCDKILVGQVAAEIRALKKPEPYKGKGFRYINEVIKLKAGKKSGVSG